MIFKGHCPICGGEENDIIYMKYEVENLEALGEVAIINIKCQCRNGCHQFGVSGDGSCATDIIEKIVFNAELPKPNQVCTV
jgi:hypothetical protein